MAELSVSLKEYVETLLREMELRNSQRFDAQEKAVSAALAAAEKAVTKAETASEKRFDGVNEFRQSLSDQQATFARQDVVAAQLASMDARVSALTTQGTETKGRGAGLTQAWGYVVALAAIAVAFFKH